MELHHLDGLRLGTPDLPTDVVGYYQAEFFGYLGNGKIRGA